jgi:hypothetical protein
MRYIRRVLLDEKTLNFTPKTKPVIMIAVTPPRVTKVITRKRKEWQPSRQEPPSFAIGNDREGIGQEWKIGIVFGRMAGEGKSGKIGFG